MFPVGFVQSQIDGSGLVDPEGVIYRSGDGFDAVGFVIPGRSVPGGVDGKWGNYLSFCQSESDEVVVLNSIAGAFDPASLTEEELERLVGESSFTEHWPCGRGWAVSAADQRVAIVIYQNSDEPSGTTEVIELPDVGWNAEVLIGKQLFSEHCNDAIEPWVASPTVSARWPLTSGTVILLDALPDSGAPPAPVRAILDEAVVDTGTTSIELPSIDLNNTAFNLFAG